MATCTLLWGLTEWIVHFTLRRRSMFWRMEMWTSTTKIRDRTKMAHHSLSQGPYDTLWFFPGFAFGDDFCSEAFTAATRVGIPEGFLWCQHAMPENDVLLKNQRVYNACSEEGFACTRLRSSRCCCPSCFLLLESSPPPQGSTWKQNKQTQFSGQWKERNPTMKGFKFLSRPLVPQKQPRDLPAN